MFNEIAPFLADFGLDVVVGVSSGKGLLNMPDEVVADGLVISTGYRLTAATSLIGALRSGDAITVGGQAYTVRDVRKIDDGVFAQAFLQKT